MALHHSSTLFRDTDGAVAQLHAISALKVSDTWYFYGENKVDGPHFQGMSCYSTRDFLAWKNEGLALPVGPKGTITGPEHTIERPRVFRCPSTGQFVMYVHVEGVGDYSFAHIGVAVSDTPTGPFEFRSVLQFRGYQSRDIGCFTDEDGTGYLLSEDREHGTHIYRLSQDYLSIVEDVVCLRGANDGRFGPEAPILIKRDGRYYWCGSNLTGWDCNDNVYSTATNLQGPWSDWNLFVPRGSKTYNSQCDAILPLDADPWHSCHFLYVGDQWKPDDLGNSPLLLLPITLDGPTLKLDWVDDWSDEQIGK
jgi:hypothetical protein